MMSVLPIRHRSASTTFMDLSPKRSFVEYAVSRRITMFVISWRNPGAEDREFNLIVSTRQHQRQRQPAS